MVGISSKLLRSVVILTIFHLVVGFLVFLLLNPSQYESWLSFLGKEIPQNLSLSNLSGHQFSDIKNSFLSWAVFFGAGVFAGILIPSAAVFVKKTDLKIKALQKQGWRGLSVTIGHLYKPDQVKFSKLKYSLPAEVKKNHHTMAQDLLSYHFSQKREIAVNDPDLESSYYQYLLDLIDIAIKNHKNSLLVLFILAHRLDRLSENCSPKSSSKLLGRFESWWDLDSPDRDILAQAVRFQDEPERLPDHLPYLQHENRSQILELLKQLKDVLKAYQGATDEMAPTVKKIELEVEKEVSLEEALIAAFFKAVRETPFQNYDLKPGLKSIGWRKENKLYLLQDVLEERIKEFLTLEQLQKIEVACEGESDLGHGQIIKFLGSLKVFKKWIVLQAELETKTIVTDLDNPLWVIRAGSKTFPRVLILELPPEKRSVYPKNSKYEIVIQDLYSTKKRENNGNKRVKNTKHKNGNFPVIPKELLLNQEVTYMEMMEETMETLVETPQENGKTKDTALESDLAKSQEQEAQDYFFIDGIAEEEMSRLIPGMEQN